jgi:toxin ParE1/3/4
VKPVSIRARADADIDAAIDHFLQSSSAGAVHLVDELETVIGRLARRPGSGSQRYAKLAGLEGVRSRPIGRTRYHVFYVELEESIEVIRVLHERRDIPSLLADP